MHLPWSESQNLNRQHVTSITTGPGIYKLIDSTTNSVIYVGESGNLRSRLSQHSGRLLASGDVAFSTVHNEGLTASYQRHELENDLLGDFYSQYRTARRLQFAGGDSP